MKIKCESCEHLWSIPPEPSSPYGEYACMKRGCDLYGVEPEEVADCEHYEAKEDPHEKVRIHR